VNVLKKKIPSYIVNAISVIAIYLIISQLVWIGVINNYYLGIIIVIGINIILSTSLNLTTGFLGQLTLGHAGFMSIGAYASALFSINANLPESIEFYFALLVGGICAAIVGILVGIPALRLRGDYLAIITLGFGEIIRVIILNLDFTGGAKGLFGIPYATNFTNVFFIMLLTIYIIWTVIDSRHGRAIKSIREDEIAAEAAGVPTTYYKLFAFTLGSFFAGIAGGLYSHYILIIDAAKFDFNRSIEILVIVVLGGMGSLTGAILAAVTLTILPEYLREFSEYRMLIYAVILIFAMIFRPKGLLGTSEFSLLKVFQFIKRKVIG
jgi:branched-chain amino acid transport system permease protein